MTQIFVSLQASFETLQILAPKPNETYNRFNLKRLFVIFVFIMFTTMLGLRLIPSQTFAEYSKVTLSVMSGFTGIIITPVFYWYSPKVFELIEDFNNGMEMRRFRFLLLNQFES